MTKYTRQRLFEMMNRVTGMPLMESTDLPPGITNKDIITLDQFADGADVNEDTTDVKMQPADLRGMLDVKKTGVRDREQPYIHNKTVEIIDKNGKEIDQNWLRDQITQRPATLLGTNEKVGKTGILKISLPAYKGLFYDESDNTFKVVDTCPNAGTCKQYCYQQKGRSVMFDVAVISKSRILNFLLNHWKEFEYKMIDEIETARITNEKKGIDTIVRWHDSGDFLSDKYLELAMAIAAKTPKVLHYAYTKMVGFAKRATVPPNFVFRYSVDPESPETQLINKLKDKHAEVVPKQLFKGLLYSEKVQGKKGVKLIWHYNSPEAINELKAKIATFFEIDINTIITSDELVKMPEEGVNKWNVIVTPSDADTAAHRKDVLGVYLLIH